MKNETCRNCDYDIEKYTLNAIGDHLADMGIEIVTLCGSTKFKDAYLDAQKRLTLEGKIVLTVGSMMHADKVPTTEEEKKRLDELYLKKIELSSVILVLNVGGYIGESTRREIEHAKELGRKIEFLEEAKGR